VVQLALWFVTGWGRGREMVMCAVVSVMVCYRLGRRREMVMCGAVSVMVCYRMGEREGNGDVCCS